MQNRAGAGLQTFQTASGSPLLDRMEPQRKNVAMRAPWLQHVGRQRYCMTTQMFLASRWGPRACPLYPPSTGVSTKSPAGDLWSEQPACPHLECQDYKSGQCMCGALSL